MLLSFPRLLFETESRLITPSLPSLPRREAEFRKRFKKRGGRGGRILHPLHSIVDGKGVNTRGGAFSGVPCGRVTGVVVAEAAATRDKPKEAEWWAPDSCTQRSVL